MQMRYIRFAPLWRNSMSTGSVISFTVRRCGSSCQSRLIVDAWLVDYLETDRDVRVLWIVDGTLAGPSIERLLESGSAIA